MNRVTVTAKLLEHQSLRYTPAGIPALDMLLEHEADSKDGHDASVQIQALAFSLNAEALAKTPLGSTLKVEGFLRHSAKSKKLIIQIHSFEII